MDLHYTLKRNEHKWGRGLAGKGMSGSGILEGRVGFSDFSWTSWAEPRRPRDF